jgi:hypothetical protein
MGYTIIDEATIEEKAEDLVKSKSVSDSIAVSFFYLFFKKNINHNTFQDFGNSL